MQNYALVIAILTLSYTGCDRADALTFPLIASVWYVIWSAVLTLAFLASKRWQRFGLEAGTGTTQRSRQQPKPDGDAAASDAKVAVGVV